MYILKGSSSNGYVAYYADIAVNVDEFISDYAFKTTDGVHYLTGYVGNNTELTLPTDYQGNIYQIGDYAFYKCSSLTAINIPESVTSIGDYAFSGCSSLTTITLPEGVTSIGNRAFNGCSSLTAINIPASVTSIGEDAFSGCNSLERVTINCANVGDWFSRFSSIKEVVLGDGVTSIGEDAFYGCSSLTTITIPEGVTSIGQNAFYQCSSLTTITIPEGVTSIGEGAFSNYSGELVINCNLPSVPYYSGIAYYGSEITKLTIGEGVTSIGEGAFAYCSSLTAITIPESVTSIGDNAFSGCSSLAAITIPEGVTRIGSYAFSGCSSLTAITIPGSVTSIGNRAFYNCSSLTSITIPESVTSIGEGAFGGCYFSSDNFINNSGCVSGYWYETIYDKEYDGIFIQNNTTVVDCRPNVISVVIPDGVTSIGAEAFEGCSSLTTITIPEGVTSIGSSAFSGCSSLEKVTINCATVGDWFSKLSSIKEVVLGDGVTSIGKNAFYQCCNLKEVTLGSGIRTIGANAFSSCTALEKVTTYATRPPLITDDIFSAATYENATLYVPKGCIDKYQVMAGWSGFYNITEIVVAVTDVVISQSSATITEIETLTLTATVTPDDATDSSVTWSSSAPSVATVDNTGKVTAIAPGSVTITATANDGSGVSASCEVTVIPASYVITFLIDGEQFYTQTLTRGSTITLPEAPTKEGHTFSGWGEVPETMPAHDVTYEGSYSINSYTLTYVVDGEVVLTLPILYGGSIPSLKEPAKEGYTFSGWSEVPETMPANDVTIEGTFTQLPSVFLTINQADNGYVKQHLTAGTVCTFTIEAAEGWKIHTVTFNGEDVTSQLEEGNIYTTPEMLEDAVLNISYEQEVPEGVENAHARAIKVRGLDNTIHISGLAEDTTVTLYTTDGVMVAHQQSNAGEAKFTVDTNQVYLVHIGDKVVKIGM